MNKGIYYEYLQFITTLVHAVHSQSRSTLISSKGRPIVLHITAPGHFLLKEVPIFLFVNDAGLYSVPNLVHQKSKILEICEFKLQYLREMSINYSVTHSSVKPLVDGMMLGLFIYSASIQFEEIIVHQWCQFL